MRPQGGESAGNGRWGAMAELIGKAAADDGFRARLTADPKAAVKEAPRVDLPESLTVHVHEETALSAHIVLPPMVLLDVDDLKSPLGSLPNE